MAPPVAVESLSETFCTVMETELPAESVAAVPEVEALTVRTLLDVPTIVRAEVNVLVVEEGQVIVLVPVEDVVELKELKVLPPVMARTWLAVFAVVQVRL